MFTAEELTIILQGLIAFNDTSEEMKKIQEKIRLFIERENLSKSYNLEVTPINERYQEQFKELEDRYNKLIETKEDK